MLEYSFVGGGLKFKYKRNISKKLAFFLIFKMS